MENEIQNALFKANLTRLKLIFKEDAKNAAVILENLLKKIDSLNEEEIDLYIVTVHGMKSALANIGEKELSDLALKLELTAKDGRFDEIKSETSALISALLNFIDTIKPVNDEECDASYLREKLCEIKTACKNYDKTHANTLLNDLKQKNISENIKNILDDTAKNISNSAFKKAIFIVESINI